MLKDLLKSFLAICLAGKYQSIDQIIELKNSIWKQACINRHLMVDTYKLSKLEERKED